MIMMMMVMMMMGSVQCVMTTRMTFLPQWGRSLTACEPSVDRLGAANPPPSHGQFDRTKRLPP